ncbi:MAG TPA: hypothetical protein V6D28_24420 [Leptolyngbyaceae cyanobacterium]
MSEITLNPEQLKEILKSAIAEGETSELASRDSIFQLLEPKS